MAKFSKFLGVAAAVASLSLVATAAQATPYTAGSFSITVVTDTTTDVTTTTNFHIDQQVPHAFGATGDFTDAGVVFPSALNASTQLNFGAGPPPTGFDFSFTNFGSFTATSATLVSSTSGTNAGVQWNVVGSFTVGTFWDNAGAVLTANETWTCNQTGGPGNAISCGGTFHAPAIPVRAPEPLTLSLFGAGLAGAAVIRRRRKKTA